MLTGSTTRAARALHISQPAVSRALTELEGRIGVKLFLRQGGRLHPNPQAQWLFEESEDTLARFDRLDGLLRDLPTLPERRLRILANSAMAHAVLPRAVATFRKVAADVRISQQIVVRRDNRRWIKDQDFDLAAIMLPIDYPPEGVRSLTTVSAVCIMPQDHPLAIEQIIHPHMLDGQLLVSLNHESLTRYRLERLIEKFGLRTTIGIETQTGASVCAYVAAGLGIAIIDPFTALQFVALGLTVRPFAGQIDYEYGVLFPLRQPYSSLAEMLVPIIASSMAELLRSYEKDFPGWVTQATT